MVGDQLHVELTTAADVVVDDAAAAVRDVVVQTDDAADNGDVKTMTRRQRLLMLMNLAVGQVPADNRSGANGLLSRRYGSLM